jgi:hypothetical protein
MRHALCALLPIHDRDLPPPWTTVCAVGRRGRSGSRDVHGKHRPAGGGTGNGGTPPASLPFDTTCALRANEATASPLPRKRLPRPGSTRFDLARPHPRRRGSLARPTRTPGPRPRAGPVELHRVIPNMADPGRHEKPSWAGRRHRYLPFVQDMTIVASVPPNKGPWSHLTPPSPGSPRSPQPTQHTTHAPEHPEASPSAPLAHPPDRACDLGRRDVRRQPLSLRPSECHAPVSPR